jgi:hypothetical protein
MGPRRGGIPLPLLGFIAKETALHKSIIALLTIALVLVLCAYFFYPAANFVKTGATPAPKTFFTDGNPVGFRLRLNTRKDRHSNAEGRPPETNLSIVNYNKCLKNNTCTFDHIYFRNPNAECSGESCAVPDCPSDKTCLYLMTVGNALEIKSHHTNSERGEEPIDADVRIVLGHP